MLRIWQVRYAPKLGEPMDDRFVESLKWTDTVLDLLGDLQYRTRADAEQAMRVLKEGGKLLKLYDYVNLKENENGIIGR